jgi:hypothetical protein
MPNLNKPYFYNSFYNRNNPVMEDKTQDGQPDF